MPVPGSVCLLARYTLASIAGRSIVFHIPIGHWAVLCVLLELEEVGHGAATATQRCVDRTKYYF